MDTKMNTESLADRLVENACLLLQSEMQLFFTTQFHALLKPIPAEIKGKVISSAGNAALNRVLTQAVTTNQAEVDETWRNVVENVQVAQRNLLQESTLDPALRHQARDSTHLLNTVDWMAATFKARVDSAVDLTERAGLLSQFTVMWNIYQVAWQQRHNQSIASTSTTGLSLENIRASDRVVRDLYRVVIDRDLDLLLKNVDSLIVVPFGARLLAYGFDTPTPYIISPYWGHRQVWTWLGYAHEVGHHVYRNINGLSDELKTQVAMELRTRGEPYEVQSIWFNWIEEIFADLFGLLRIGPPFIRTQELMLAHLPRPTVLNDKERVALDPTHPLPYIRRYLATQALALLQDGSGNAQPSQTNQDLHRSQKEVTLFPLVRGRHISVKAEDMMRVADIVLDVMLHTKLYALAPTTNPKAMRTAQEVFYEALTKDTVDKAFSALAGGPSGNGYDVRHVLAATQHRLERLPARTRSQSVDDDVETLGQTVVTVINAIPRLQAV